MRDATPAPHLHPPRRTSLRLTRPTAVRLQVLNDCKAREILPRPRKHRRPKVIRRKQKGTNSRVSTVGKEESAGKEEVVVKQEERKGKTGVKAK